MNSRLFVPGVLAAAGGLVGAAYWALMSPFSQLAGEFPYRGQEGAKVIALTFDDGPNEPYTSQLADFLAAEGIRATFFQVGRCVERFPETTRRLAADGHLIGNHSYSHHFTRCLRGRAQRAETERTQRVLQEVLGAAPRWYRPPWLLRVPPLLPDLSRAGLRPVSGEFCHPLEVFQGDPGRIARRALAKVRPGTILIFHDGFDDRGGNRASTVAAVKIVVTRLKAEGHTFATVEELLDPVRESGQY